MNKELSIQQVAAITGLGIHTLRYYERLGLLASTRISRLPNGHRRYSEVDSEQSATSKEHGSSSGRKHYG
ncbi:MAG: MerR family DNA-binding transcriptional regulator [Ktedonobacteraceae bacterium]